MTLDTSRAVETANEIISNLQYEGYELEDMISGLVQAIVILVDSDEVLLDAATNLLADGGVMEDVNEYE